MVLYLKSPVDKPKKGGFDEKNDFFVDSGGNDNHFIGR